MRFIWVLLAALVIVVALAMFFINRPESEQRQSNSLVDGRFDVLPDQLLLTLEGTDDYPNDPAVLHSPRIHVINARSNEEVVSLDVPTFSEMWPVAISEEHIYFAEQESGLVKELRSDQVIDTAGFGDARLGGSIAVFGGGDDPEKLAWLYSSFTGGQNTAEIKVLSAGSDAGAISKTIVAKTMEGQQTIVLHGWSENGDALLYSTFNFDEDQNLKQGFVDLFQVKVGTDIRVDAEPLEIEFPEKDSRLMALDDSDGSLFFAGEESLFVTSLEEEKELSIDLPSGFTGIADIVAADGNAAALLSGESGDKLMLIDKGGRRFSELSIDTNDLKLLTFSDNNLIYSRAGQIDRGTWSLPINAGQAQVESQVSPFVTLLLKTL